MISFFFILVSQNYILNVRSNKHLSFSVFQMLNSLAQIHTMSQNDKTLSAESLCAKMLKMYGQLDAADQQIITQDFFEILTDAPMDFEEILLCFKPLKIISNNERSVWRFIIIRKKC